MKKTLFYIFCIILAGVIAYFTSYYIYSFNHPKSEAVRYDSLQKAAQTAPTDEILEEQSYYKAKIQQDSLIIYQMPEEKIYETVNLSSLYLSKNERIELLNGIVFQSLTEVYEFLENSMS